MKVRVNEAGEEQPPAFAGRLRRVCGHFAEDEFAALVNRMAEIEVRYRLREDWMRLVSSSPSALN